MAQAMLKITLVKSVHGYESDQMDTARALGLRRMHQSVVRLDTPSLRGMVRKITHLVATEEVSGQEVTPTFRRHRPTQVEPSRPTAVAKPTEPTAPARKVTSAAKPTAKVKTGAAPKVAPKTVAKDAVKAPAKAQPTAKPKAKAVAPTASAKAPSKTKTRKEPTAK